MSGHAIFAIGGNEHGETVYCTCGANVHEPAGAPMLSAWSAHVEQAVREQVTRHAGMSVVAYEAESRLRTLMPEPYAYAELLDHVAKAVTAGVSVVELFTDVNLSAMSADVSCRLVREDQLWERIAQEIERAGEDEFMRDGSMKALMTYRVAAKIARGEQI